MALARSARIRNDSSAERRGYVGRGLERQLMLIRAISARAAQATDRRGGIMALPPDDAGLCPWPTWEARRGFQTGAGLCSRSAGRGRIAAALPNKEDWLGRAESPRP